MDMQEILKNFPWPDGYKPVIVIYDGNEEFTQFRCIATKENQIWEMLWDGVSAAPNIMLCHINWL